MLIKKEEFYKYLLIERNLSKLTYISYSSDLDEFDSFLLRENISFDDIDHKTIRSFNGYLINKNNSKRSIARKNSSLRSYYRFLINNSYYDKNPFLLVDRVRIDKKLPEFLTVNEVLEILTIDVSKNQFINIRNKAIIHMLYSSGARISEIVNLKIKDINLEEKTFIVNGKGRKQRVCFINPLCKKQLIKYLEESRPNLIDINNLNDSLFLSIFGTQITQRSVEKFLNEIGKKMNTPKRLYPHIFRHSFATHLLDNGADLRSVQELLGHESLAATQIYTHISNKKLHEIFLKCNPRAKSNNNK